MIVIEVDSQTGLGLDVAASREGVQEDALVFEGPSRNGCSKKSEWYGLGGTRYMRFSQAEKMEIFRIVEGIRTLGQAYAAQAGDQPEHLLWLVQALHRGSWDRAHPGGSIPSHDPRAKSSAITGR